MTPEAGGAGKIFVKNKRDRFPKRDEEEDEREKEGNLIIGANLSFPREEVRDPPPLDDEGGEEARGFV